MKSLNQVNFYLAPFLRGVSALALFISLIPKLASPSDWGNMYFTKHNFFKTEKGMMPAYTYDRTDFKIFCFACHIKATPYVKNSDRFQIYGYGSKTLIKKNIFPQSVLCLSCHDGFIAQNISPFKQGSHHPFFIVYKKEKYVLRPEETKIQGWEGASQIIQLIERFNNTLQCVSCHDPHLNKKSFLRRSNEGSMLCLSCHEK